MSDDLHLKLQHFNQSAVTAVMSRLMTILGIPACGLLVFSIMQDIKQIEQHQFMLHERIIIVETRLGIKPERMEYWDAFRQRLNNES